MKEIKERLDKGYTMSIYGTRESIHEQMTKDIQSLLLLCEKKSEWIEVINKAGDFHKQEAPLNEIRYIGKEYPKRIQIFTCETQHIIRDTFEEAMECVVDKFKKL